MTKAFKTNIMQGFLKVDAAREELKKLNEAAEDENKAVQNFKTHALLAFKNIGAKNKKKRLAG